MVGVYGTSKAAANGMCPGTRSSHLYFIIHEHNSSLAYGETLAKEVAPFGIRVLTVIPGAFATGGIPGIPDTPKFEDYRLLYDAVRRASEERRKNIRGDPKKYAGLLVDVVRGEGSMLDEKGELRQWPERLIAGSDAVADINNMVKSWENTIEVYGDLARSTDKSKL